MAGLIFINYRRGEALQPAELLNALLSSRFGRDNVFLDTHSLAGGDKWARKIEQKIDASSAMVVLIGPGWADTKDQNGDPRLHNHNDFVRIEITRALDRNVPLVPVLLDGAKMPASELLPMTMWPLLQTQAWNLRTATFTTDAEAIGGHLQTKMPKRWIGRKAVAAIIGVLVVLAAGIAIGISMQPKHVDYTPSSSDPAEPSD